MIRWIVIAVYLGSFIASFIALSCVRYEMVCKVQDVRKVWLLHLLLAMGLGFIVGEFILSFTLYHI